MRGEYGTQRVEANVSEGERGGNEGVERLWKSSAPVDLYKYLPSAINRDQLHTLPTRANVASCLCRVSTQDPRVCQLQAGQTVTRTLATDRSLTRWIPQVLYSGWLETTLATKAKQETKRRRHDPAVAVPSVASHLSTIFQYGFAGSLVGVYCDGRMADTKLTRLDSLSLPCNRPAALFVGEY